MFSTRRNGTSVLRKAVATIFTHVITNFAWRRHNRWLSDNWRYRIGQPTQRQTVTLPIFGFIAQELTAENDSVVINFITTFTSRWMQVAGKAGSGGQLTPLKFGAQVRNCIWRLCRTGVKVMAMTTCLTISTISRGGVKINVSCYMMLHEKTWVLTLTPPPFKMVPARLDEWCKRQTTSGLWDAGDTANETGMGRKGTLAGWDAFLSLACVRMLAFADLWIVIFMMLSCILYRM